MNKKNYRKGVGVVVVNNEGQFFLGKRIGAQAWQFPQGGLDNGESTVEAIYRETEEEVGLKKIDLRIIKESEDWFDYKIPEHRIPKYFRFKKSKFIGQTQKWFLAEILCEDSKINLNASSPVEFNDWTWTNYWYPINGGVEFKKKTYRKVLTSFLPYYNTFIKNQKT